MKYALIPTVFLSFVFPLAAHALYNLPAETTTSTVFIANYDRDSKFIGWGSGFFVDEGIVVTNKHVIEAGNSYRVYATGTDEKVNLDCYKAITKSDVKINLDDDVAYMRAYVPCEHGTMNFAEDPEYGDLVSVIGFPYKGSVSASMQLSVTSGAVVGHTEDGWLGTDAFLDFGNSGGPVISDGNIAGVAVAKGVDSDGNYAVGYFIPSSVILHGLLYANDSRFGYTPQSSIAARSARFTSSSVSSSVSSSSQSSSASSFSSSRSARSSSSSRSSRRSSAAQTFSDVSVSREGYEAILSLRDRGVIGGYPDGTFRPDLGINRAEFIKILVAGFRSDALLNETNCFSDVTDEWFARYVCAAKRLGWIDGYPDPSLGSGQALLFKPAQQINRAEAMKIVIEAFGGRVVESDDVPSDVRIGTWFHRYVAQGVTIGIVNADILFHPADNLTREDAAIWIDGAGE